MIGTTMAHAILIVDDDPQVLNMLSQYLGKSLGYKTTAVTSGEDAINAALAQHYDLCILDVHLPGQSGSETYTRLKSLLPDVEAIFFTADQEFEQRLDFLRFSLPPDRVLTKPLDSFGGLTKLIINILGPPTR
jgi:CheY-like chemotaxis protein